MKNGVDTSEFWMALAVLAAATFLAYNKVITPENWQYFAGIVTTAWIVSRTALKGIAMKNGNGNGTVMAKTGTGKSESSGG